MRTRVRKAKIEKIVPEGYVEVRFNASDEIAKEHYTFMMKSGEFSSALDEIYRITRAWLKHGDTDHLRSDDIERLEEIKRLSSCYFD